MTKVAQNAAGSWDIIKAGAIIATYATMREALDARYELKNVKAPVVRYWKADGSEVTKRPRQLSR